MKNRIKWILSVLILFGYVMFSMACKKEDVNTLVVNPEFIEFEQTGGSTIITLETNAASWSVENPAADWLLLSTNSGTYQTAMISLSVSSKTVEPRLDTLVIRAGNAKPRKIIVSQKTSDYLYTLSSNLNSVSFKRAGNTTALRIETDAPEWTITSDVDWIQFSQTSGVKGIANISVNSVENTNTSARQGTITLKAQYAPDITIAVSQKGEYYPGYNTNPLPSDNTGMSSNAVELAAKINLGWNLGNTLEAIGGETAWGNPRTTKAFITFVKQSGFNAIRIPCAWNQYMENSATAKLKTDWLNRVKEVVQYCVENDMYVIINIHWDGGWLENNCTPNKEEENNAKQKAFWEQIATHLRDFDEHLLFAGTNEPNVDDATQMAVLKTYHQTFIDAVRSTGGKNAYRVLVVQGPSTDIEKTNKLMLSMPVDQISNRLMVEVHYYTPWNFCGMTKDETWGKMFYYWGAGNHSATDIQRNATWGEEATVDANFKLMKQQFVDKGIPVVLGEFAPTRRSALTGDALTLHLKSRAYYLKYVTEKAKENGMLPFYWDNGGTDNNASGIFYRGTNAVFDKQALDAMVLGVVN